MRERIAELFNLNADSKKAKGLSVRARNRQTMTLRLCAEELTADGKRHNLRGWCLVVMKRIKCVTAYVVVRVVHMQREEMKISKDGGPFHAVVTPVAQYKGTKWP